MCCRVIVCLTLALNVLFAMPAHAAVLKTEDLGIIKACLEKADRKATPQGAAEGCVDLVARRCYGGDEGKALPTQIVGCFDRERLAWDAILNESYQTMMERLDDMQRGKLRAMQQSWIQTRDLSCMFLVDYFEGSMAYPMVASCTNREVARRAIYLRSFAIDLADRKTRAVRSTY